jgi:hypothetical protein
MDLPAVLNRHKVPLGSESDKKTARAPSMDSDEGLTAFELLERSLTEPMSAEL